MSDTLDGELKRQRRQKDERRAADQWRRRYGAMPIVTFDVSTVREFPEQDRALIADFLRRVSPKQVRKGVVVPHPDGSKWLLTSNHAAMFTTPLVWLRRRRDGEKVTYVEVVYTSGLHYKINLLSDGIRFTGGYPRRSLKETLASALLKTGR